MCSFPPLTGFDGTTTGTSLSGTDMLPVASGDTIVLSCAATPQLGSSGAGKVITTNALAWASLTATLVNTATVVNQAPSGWSNISNSGGTTVNTN